MNARSAPFSFVMTGAPGEWAVLGLALSMGAYADLIHSTGVCTIIDVRPTK